MAGERCICRDTGFIEVDDSSVQPCHRCRPEQYDHWTKGGYDLDAIPLSLRKINPQTTEDRDRKRFGSRRREPAGAEF